MTTIARLKVLLEADSHRMTNALHKVKRAVFNVRNAVGLLGGSAGLGAMINSQLRAADEMQKFSKRIGISTEALSELRHAAKLSGVETNALQMGMQRMVRRLSEVASTGKGTAAPALAALGLEASKLVEMEPDKQLEAIAEAMTGVKTQSERVALAFKLFDSEGVRMLQMMENGSKGLNDMRENARALNVTLGQEQADAAARALDAMTNLNAAVQALVRTFSIGLAPEISNALEWVVSVLPKVIAGFKTVGRVLGAIGATAAAIFRGDFSGAAAVGRISVGEIYQEALDESMPETARNTAKANEHLRDISSKLDDWSGAVYN